MTPFSQPILVHSLVVLAALATADAASAHGYAGKRFFPATLATEDPFVADELSLPTVSWRRTRTEDGTSSRDTAIAADFSKRLTPNFGIGLGATWLQLKPEGVGRQRGFDNLEASVKYQLWKSAEHEALVSIGADWDIGGSGAKRVGAEWFSTLTPGVFAGKGFGDLPDTMRWLRPLALTGSLGVGIPSRAHSTTVDDDGNAVDEPHPHVLSAGLAIEYSLPYLHAFVKDVGLPPLVQRMVPLIEVTLSKPLDRGGGPTIGTLNPGVLIAGRTMQFGIEAMVPINRHTGGGTGVRVQVHFFLDDLFPRTVGRPLFRDGR
jgi:hypothetical protein